MRSISCSASKGKGDLVGDKGEGLVNGGKVEGSLRTTRQSICGMMPPQAYASNSVQKWVSNRGKEKKREIGED